MTIANVLQIFLMILGIMLVFQAYWLAATALFPKVINNARDRYKKPVSTTLIGLAIIAPTMLIGFVLLDNLPNPLVNAIGFLIAVLPLLFGAIGSAGLCQLIGHGLPAPTDQAQNWKRVWRGGCAAVDERSAVRSERRVVHVPGCCVGELRVSCDGAV